MYVVLGCVCGGGGLASLSTCSTEWQHPGGCGARMCGAACWVVTIILNVQDATKESLVLMSRGQVGPTLPRFR